VRPIPLVDLDALYADIGSRLEEAALRVCRGGQFVGGPEVASFERAFATYLGARHAIGIANGTQALELALRACGVGAGNDVLVPANTFIATAEAVRAVGATPRFVDVYRDSGLLDLESCKQRITDRTRAIVPVHLYGRVADMDAVLGLAREHALIVIEDAAQAHGASRNGRKAGTFGLAGSFSFYPGKNLGAWGDAGAIVTDSDELADQVRLIRDHGRRGRDEHEIVGTNARLDALQAAVLAVKLEHLDRWNTARREAASRYRELLDPGLLDWSSDDPEAEVHHIFPILLDRRDELGAHLGKLRISTAVHYRHALPETKAFAPSADACPVAGARSHQQLSIPMHPYLDDADIERVVNGIEGFLGAAKAPPRTGAATVRGS